MRVISAWSGYANYTVSNNLLAHMELTPAIIAKLEAYTLGKLSATETTELRQQIESDPAFKSAVAAWETVYRIGLQAPPATGEQRQQMRQQLDQLEADQPIPTINSRSKTWPRLAAAAAVLLCLALGWQYLSKDRVFSPAALAQEHFSWLSRKNATLSGESIARRAGEAYDDEDYQAALPLLLSALEQEKMDSTALLYAGVAALGISEPQTADSLFSVFLTTQWPAYYPSAKYYQALAKLELGKINDAKQLLEEVATTQDPLAPQARQLLTALPE